MPSLYPFQQQAVDELCDGKRLAILPTGTGKTAVMMRWLNATDKKRILIVTTPSKVKSGDFLKEAVTWCGQSWLDGLTEIEIISWHKLKQWKDYNLWRINHAVGGKGNAHEWAIAFDEVAKAKAGWSSGMGRAFVSITSVVNTWTGYTATPGDKWIDLHAYMVAAKKVKNKTAFLNEYANVNTFKGYPEITGYKNTSKLYKIWDEITTRPDASQVIRELPPETHEVVEFKAPSIYKKLLDDCIDPRTGEYVETAMGMVHLCRQFCFTKEKQEWLKDFIEGLGTNCVFFCNYIEEEELVCEIAEKSLPDGARVWRIDGKHHEIPTAETIGKYDVVVAHYASGGEALNLQFMNYWCSISPNYSLSTSVQARGRIKRIGQKHDRMFFYYLKAVDTIEDDIYDCLREKKDFSEDIWLAKKGLNDLK